MKAKATVRLQTNVETQDSGKVRLGDASSPTFGGQSSVPNKKVARDPASQDTGKVRLGDFAPSF
jgi:hypothetical protein